MNNIKYKAQEVCGNTTFYYIENKNKKDETIIISIDECNRKIENIKHPEKWLAIQTYVKDSEGNCRGDYNPTIERDGNHWKTVIFPEATEQGRQDIINIIFDLFITAEGKSASEIKMEKIYEYAKTAGVDIVYSIPEGWKKMHSTTNPFGTERINNGEKYFTNINGKIEKNPKYKEALLIY